MNNRVHFVSLGCAKNLVDSQVMLGMLKTNMYEVIDDPAQASTIIVNTCSFIEAARKESIDMILEMADYKESGQLEHLVVSGCLPQRYSKELEVELPEVDLFIGTGEYQNIVPLLQKKATGELTKKSFVDIPQFIHTDEDPRVDTGTTASSYLKISEGCARRCSFCIIPDLRGGKVRSRTVASLRKEAEKLVAGGTRELNLVAQDLTHFGIENRYQENLADLLRSLVQIEDLRWIRLLYAYPDNLTDDVIDLIASEPKIAKYIEMPLQHVNDSMLQLMNRKIRFAGINTLMHKLRKRIPDLVFRTTFIVGHPGETEESFAQLEAAVREFAFDHLGIFKYSIEEGTKSEKLAKELGLPDENIVKERYNRLMQLQQEISIAKNQARLGKTLEVLVEGTHPETSLLLRGRWAGQAPEIDGNVLINDGNAEVGQFVQVAVTEAHPYDLVGKIV